jgi:tRNA1Val (adenine37-N6)-methyltransferase
MKVGTDGVLLGAWANVLPQGEILDVGTGTGLVAIMLAQRSSVGIDAVEIDENAYLQAIENVSHSPWNGRVRVYHSSFQEFCKQTQKKYGIIVSNPPYFSNSLKTPELARTIARHNDSLKPENLLAGVAELLANDGCFCVILPYVESQLFVIDAAMHQLYCVRKTLVKPTKQKNPARVLLEFSRTRTKVEDNELIIHGADGGYSFEYKALTGDFYQKL